jgi:hypothetical protein
MFDDSGLTSEHPSFSLGRKQNAVSYVTRLGRILQNSTGSFYVHVRTYVRIFPGLPGPYS